MFWGIYYSLVVTLKPFARLGLKIFSGFTETKRARVLVHRGGQVLLVRDIFSGKQWSMPGGGINKNEASEVAAAREMLEEIGVEIDPSDLQYLEDVERYTAEGQTYNAVLYAYEVKGEFNLKVYKWEIVEARWFNLAAMPPDRDSSVDVAIRSLRQG